MFITYSADGVRLESFENKRGAGVDTEVVVLAYERYDDGKGELAMRQRR